MKFAVITFAQSTDTDKGTAAGPEALLRAGFAGWLREKGHDVSGPFHVRLRQDEAAVYGTWNKIGLANAHLARLVSDAGRKGDFPLILESNCYAAIGVLAGLEKSADRLSPRLGMVWIDAHGDCNTPETTLSGMLSGMPVAIALGLCLTRFRQQSGLDVPVDPRDVIMVCVRANDPLEEELIAQSGIELVPVADVKSDCQKLRAAMERLSGSADLIYVHFDVDALDAPEVASMWLTAPGGPTRTELAAAMRIVMAYKRIAAFGIADINPERDTNGQMVQAALSVVKSGIAGLAG
jgi:arginase